MNATAVRILLIDDDPDFCTQFVRKIMAIIPFDFVVARDLTDGIEKLKTDPPKVVLLDIKLPDDKGSPGRTVDAVKRCCGEAPLLVLSGDDRAETKRETVRNTAMSHMCKDEVLKNPNLAVNEILHALEWQKRMNKINRFRHLS